LRKPPPSARRLFSGIFKIIDATFVKKAPLKLCLKAPPMPDEPSAKADGRKNNRIKREKSAEPRPAAGHGE
jgi:hypothetical protein